MRAVRSWTTRAAIALFIFILLPGCASPVAPSAAKPTLASAMAALAGTVPNNLGAGDALAMLKDQLAALNSGPLATSAGESLRGLLVGAVEQAIEDTGDGSYDAARDVVKNTVQVAISKQFTGPDQSRLLQTVGIALQCIDNASRTTVDTRYGKVAGAAGLVDSWVWKGIPYAKPPVGDLRWRAPQEPAAWNGVRQSTDKYDVCAQIAQTRAWQSQGNMIGSEDCLYLNVWRPKNDDKNLPVYFWIHGGGNNFGTGKTYEGSVLAMRSNVVVVTINYRLGPLGWFNHPALKAGATQAESSGNFGLLDIIKALQWVHDNIQSFGGDPNNVTVAGESAGGRNTLSLVICPLARGLFQRALAESAGQDTVSIADGIATADSTIDQLLVADGKASNESAAAAYREKMSDDEVAKYLRSKDAAALLKVKTSGGLVGLLHSAFEDGYVIPGNIIAVISSGNYNHVPIIMGSNKYEVKPFMPLLGGNIPTTGFHRWSDLYKVLNGELTLDQVMPSQFDRELYEDSGLYGTLSWKARYVDAIARALKDRQPDVYCYLFQWGDPGSGPAPFDFIIGAGHATEIPFFFGWPVDTFGYSFTEQNRPGREELQKDMMSYAAQFARTGDPNTPGGSLTVWQPWSNDAGAAKCIVFDATDTQAKISMMTEEVTLAGIQKEIDGLPLLIKVMVRLWARIQTS